jgi:hypothetical protein
MGRFKQLRDRSISPGCTGWGDCLFRASLAFCGGSSQSFNANFKLNTLGKQTMSNKSDYLANKVLEDHYETAAAYLEVSSSRIDKAGTGTTAPSTVSRTEIPDTVSANNVTNATEIDFGQVGAADDAFLAKWWRTMSASTGGNQLHQGLIGTDPFEFDAEAADNRFTIRRGSFTPVNDDQVMFDSRVAADLPGGVTAGTVYFVLNVDANGRFTISTTQDGSELDITADGVGFGVKGSGISLVENQNLKVPASSLSIDEH